MVDTGAMTVAGTMGGANTTVTVDGTVILSGGGTLALLDSGSVVEGHALNVGPLFARPGQVRTNLVAHFANAEIADVDGTIRGGGEIDGTPTSGGSMALVNEAWGRIDATGGTLPLTIANAGTIASCAPLLALVARRCGYAPGTFVHAVGDAHIYSDLVDRVRERLSRAPRPLPRLHPNPEMRDLFGFAFEDIAVEGYGALAGHPGAGGGVTGSRSDGLGRTRSRRGRSA